EHVLDREPPGLDREPRDVDLLCQLVRRALERLLLAAEAEGLAQEEPRRAVARGGEVRLLRLAVAEPGEADRVAQPETLEQLGIVVDGATVPDPHAHKGAARPGLARLREVREAVRPRVGRAERRIALLDVGRLRVQLPAVRFGADPGVALDAVGGAELAVEADAQRVEIERRRIVRAGGKLRVGADVLAVEILGPCAPVRRERVFDAGAEAPAGAPLEL